MITGSNREPAVLEQAALPTEAITHLTAAAVLEGRIKGSAVATTAGAWVWKAVRLAIPFEHNLSR